MAFMHFTCRHSIAAIINVGVPASHASHTFGGLHGPPGEIIYQVYTAYRCHQNKNSIELVL